MTQSEIEAKKMTDIHGIVWKPLQVDGVCGDYLISENRDVYNFKRRIMMSSNCTKQKYKGRYVHLRCGKNRRCFSLDVLMLIAFPDQSPQGEEVWKTITIRREPSSYEVNQSGIVRRIDNHRIIKPVMRPDGYCLIRLRHNGETVTTYLHRIVANAFIPNPNGFEIVNHKDENRSNNDASNLEWCDKSYNAMYAGAAKRAGVHASITRKLRALAAAGNQQAMRILDTPKYYEDAALLETAVAIIA